MEVYYIIVFFIFGLVFGSFFNVVGYRIPNNMSIIKPSSHCTKCNHILTPIELIPVLSYIFQKGKCKHCGTKIAIFYPIFEIITGILFALNFLAFGFSIDLIIGLIFTSMILIAIITDILYMVIPDSLLIISCVLIFILKIINVGISNIYILLLDMIVPFIIMILIKILGNFLFKKESLGDGDIKLLVVIGLVIGWKLSIFTIFLAAFIALPISIIVLIRKNEHELPFGPYIGISALICLLTKIDINTILKIVGIN